MTARRVFGSIAEIFCARSYHFPAAGLFRRMRDPADHAARSENQKWRIIGKTKLQTERAEGHIDIGRLSAKSFGRFDHTFEVWIQVHPSQKRLGPRVAFRIERMPNRRNLDRKSTRLNSSHVKRSRMPSSA